MIYKTKDLSDIIKDINNKHRIGLTEEDVVFFDWELYISTSRAAKLLNVTYWAFTNTHLPVLMSSKSVRKYSISKNKYYNFSDLEDVLRKAIIENKSVKEVCIAKKKGGK